MGERKDNRMCFHERSGVLSVLGRAVCSWFRVSSAAGFLAIAPFLFAAGGGTAGDEAAFSAGLGTELSEVGRSLCSSAAGAVNSSLNASRAQVESISLQSSNRFLAFSAAGLLAVVPFSLPAGDEAPFSSAAEDVS